VYLYNMHTQKSTRKGAFALGENMWISCGHGVECLGVSPILSLR
jgi:hypothetical protein